MTELILNKRIKQNKKQTQNRINPKQIRHHLKENQEF